MDLSSLRVLGFCDYYSEASSGGAERVTGEVYSRLIAHGAKIQVVSVVPGEEEGFHEVHGVPTVTIPGRDLSALVKAQVTVARGSYRKSWEAFHRMQPNVIHASSIHFQTSVIAARLARRYSVPLVTTGHLASISALPFATRTATSMYENAVARWILRSSSRVIAVSDAVASHLRSRGADPRSIKVVHNGVDHARFHPSSRQNDRIEFVFVGRLIGNKGPEEVLDAFSRLPVADARLTFVGDGPLRQSLEELSIARGSAERVRFVGQVADVSTYLPAAHVMVRPSQTEGQSLAVLEAMACGVAVIASDIEANTELLGDGCGLLVPPGDRQAILEAMTLLATDSVLRSNVSEAGLRRSQRHSWDKTAVETGLVLADAAGLED